MEEIINLLSMHSNIFVTGIIDSISVHKTIPMLVNNKDSKNLTFQVLAANGVLLLGSILVFRRGISPVLNFVLENVGPDDIGPGSNIIDKIMLFIYQTFWLLPICGLCYACSSLWYQELADTTYKHLKGVSKNTSATKSVGFVLYATLVWLFMFIQVQLLCNVGPLIAKQTIGLVLSFFPSGDLNSGDNLMMFYGVQLLRNMVVFSLHSLALAMQFCGCILMSVLYGWYGFDPQWIAANVHPDVRFSILERHWAYFLGFGFPYVVLVKTTSFFVGYGVFLALFPFCIMLGSLSNYTEPYKKYDTVECNGDICTVIPVELEPVRFFSIAKQWTLSTLKRINKSSYESFKKEKKGGIETSKSKTVKVSENKGKEGSDHGGSRPKSILKMGSKSKAM